MSDDVTGGAFSRFRLPDRELRRAPTATEVAASVDFANLETLYVDASVALNDLFTSSWLPDHIAALETAITTTRTGTARQRIRAIDMARISTSPLGVDDLTEVLHGLAVQGASEAVAELQAQGLAVTAPEADALAALVADHAQAVAQQVADGLSLAGARRAVQISGGGFTPAEVAADMRGYLESLKHAWERDQLAGAVQQALNAGRFVVFEQIEEAPHSIYASEVLDSATCDPCRTVDEREYASMAEARRDYPTGGYSLCSGGPRCRGTVIVVLAAETVHGAVTITP